MDEKKSSLVVPVAVIACLLIVVGAFYYQSQNPSKSASQTASANLAGGSSALNQLLPAADGIDLTKFRPVDATDKIRGSANAPIKLIIYTDLECPACQYFHNELKKVEANYVTTGKVAIVYRDFPLDSIHSKSRNEFLAADCVNEVGGLEKYWQFIDKIFEISPTNNGLDPAKLGETAKALGVDTKTFDACMKAQKYASNIQKSVDEAMALGAKGTPFLILTTPNETVPVFGGVPADRLGQVFDLLLGTPAVPAETASTTAN